MATFSAPDIIISYDIGSCFLRKIVAWQQCDFFTAICFSLAGPISCLPEWTIGSYTIAMNFVRVICQILILRKNFDPAQLFQLAIGFVFGWFIDLNMALMSGIEFDTMPLQILAQLTGCTIMGIGIAFEVRCGSVTMPVRRYYYRYQ